MAERLAPWTKAPCDECGCEYQMTRSEGRPRRGRELCEGCEGYEHGVQDAEPTVPTPSERIIPALTRDDLPAVVWEATEGPLYRVVAFEDEEDGGPVLFIEGKGTDAMGAPCWRPLPAEGLPGSHLQVDVLACALLSLVGLDTSGGD